MRRLLGIFLCSVTGVAFAGEYAVLASGSRLHVDRHETSGGKVRLYNADGYIEMDAAAVRGFEVEEYVPAAPVPEAAAPAAAGWQAQACPTTQAEACATKLADAAADKYGLPRRLVRSVISRESDFQPGAVSPKGAIGLMQLMPATAEALGADPRDPAQNVDAGTRYLRDLLEKYDGGLWHALAAYNAGPGAVDKYQGVPPYRETINYVGKIDRDLKKAAGATQ
jgi:soluble lytic murein transglycosylase-like protein